MMHPISGLLGAAAIIAGAVVASTGTVGANSWNYREGGTQAPSADLNIVHGVPGLAVDNYVVEDFDVFQGKELSDVTFGTAADLNDALPGFVTPGFYLTDIVGHGGNPFKPVPLTSTHLGFGQSKTAVAYVGASAAGVAGSPKVTVCNNSVTATNGKVRVSVTHTAVAPTVGVCPDRTVPLVPAFSNGQQASTVVPAGPCSVTVAAPDNCSSVLAGPIGPVALAADATTRVYAIGTYPSTFTMASLVVPTGPASSFPSWGGRI